MMADATARTTIPLSVVIGTEPSIEGWLNDDDDGEHCPHIPNVLETALKRRPSFEEVVAKGIILNPCTPAKHQSGPWPAESPGRARALSDTVNGGTSVDKWLGEDGDVDESPHIPNELARFMKRRPSREVVTERGILKTTVQQTTAQLERRSLEQALESAIRARPSTELLIEKGIMSEVSEYTNDDDYY